MHAVLVKVSISDFEGSVKELRETVVPRISQLPGFVAGYWTRSGDGSNGRSMLVFESEEAARTAAERVGANVPEGVTFESAEVREVVASALDLAKNRALGVTTPSRGESGTHAFSRAVPSLWCINALGAVEGLFLSVVGGQEPVSCGRGSESPRLCAGRCSSRSDLSWRVRTRE